MKTLIQFEKLKAKLKTVKKIMPPKLKRLFIKGKSVVFSLLSWRYGALTLGIVMAFGVGFSLSLIAIHSTHRAASMKVETIAAQMSARSKQDYQAQREKAQINTLQKQLVQLQSQSTSHVKSLVLQISQLEKNLNAIRNSSEQARMAATNSARVSQHLYQNSQKTNATLMKQLAHINHALIKKTYLSASVLPFRVVGIDFWNGQPMATIALKDVNGVTHYQTMGKDMKFHCESGESNSVSCSNWVLTTLNAPSGTVIFTNNHDQKVKVRV